LDWFLKYPGYRAIGEPESRYRRPVSARQAIDRVMLLDGIITDPELAWLATEQDKVCFFRLMTPSLPAERLPHATIPYPCLHHSSGRCRPAMHA
jgi:hypothetical protein